MQKFETTVNTILGYFSHKALNGTMIFSGVGGTATQLVADNINLVMYWLLFGVVVAVIRIAKYKQEARHKEELHKLEVERLKMELAQNQEVHDAKMNKETPKD